MIGQRTKGLPKWIINEDKITRGKDKGKIIKHPPPRFQFNIKIKTNVPKLDRNLLKEQRDLLELYDFCWALNDGEIDPKYLEKQPPPMNSARWINGFVRGLNVVIRLDFELITENWRMYCTLITQAYAPYIFDIHFHPHLKLASIHFHKFLMATKEILQPFGGEVYNENTGETLTYFEKLFETFVRNGYCMHPEGLLLAGITYPDKVVALRALEIHAKAVEYHKNRGDVRRFEKPDKSKYNLEAKHFFDALDWANLSDNYITPSPLILGLYPDVDELRNKINRGEEIKLPKNLVMHARNNERAIRQTSLSVAKYKTHEQQTANIVASTISRKSHPLDSRVGSFLPQSE